ncbi:hypothetical protein [Kaistella carnis]|uniref:Preprotein translocase subunit SecB n=1 Tax=Kaistella carnis TaxID=1241979 RepID=A0A3G8XUT3_9FLAO|nr:hypothetical protein [Kaistella carnis]AZI31926.1 hypothetical protein EIB73_01490 [Kaistella carnis]
MKKIDVNKFDADKLHFLSFKTIEENVSVPEFFNENLINEFDTTNKVDIAFNIEQKLIRAQFDIEVATISANEKEAKTNLKFVFIFKCDNMEELAKAQQKDAAEIDANLGFAVSAISHSTARGILLVKLSDNVFSDFILPIVKPKLPE